MTTMLSTNIYLFGLSSLKEKLNIIQLPGSPDATDEFLFLHRIPARSIISVQNMGDILEPGTYHVQTSENGLKLTG